MDDDPRSSADLFRSPQRHFGRDFWLVAIAVLVLLPIFALGVRELLPDSWSDSQTCSENPDQNKCYYEPSGVDVTGR